MKTMNIIEKNLDTKQKKIVAGCLSGVLVIGVASAVILNNNGSKELIFTSNEVYAEFGQKVSTNVADYLDINKVDNLDKIIKDTKEKDNLKYVTVTNKDEQGNVVSKEEKDYPKVGNYKINFTYKDEKATVKVTVKDTTAPEITAPDSIDVIQYTDLSTFNFGELLKVTDYSDVNEWEFDTSDVDMNTIGTYDMKVSISDKYKNKATKKVKINVVEFPAVAEGEVAVTEIVTDENGNKKTVVTKKSSSSVGSNDTVTTGKPVTNTNKVEKPSTDSSTKPSVSTGTTSKPSGGDTKPSGGSTTPAKPSHTHNWTAVTKTVHHDAQTKTVHHDAVTKVVTVVDKAAYDESVYEKHYVCKKCGYDSGKDVEAMGDHIIYDCNGSYTYTSVQIGTKHHDAVTHQETQIVTPSWDETVVVKPARDETVTTGYKCSCGATK